MLVFHTCLPAGGYIAASTQYALINVRSLSVLRTYIYNHNNIFPLYSYIVLEWKLLKQLFQRFFSTTSCLTPLFTHQQMCCRGGGCPHCDFMLWHHFSCQHYKHCATTSENQTLLWMLSDWAVTPPKPLVKEVWYDFISFSSTTIISRMFIVTEVEGVLKEFNKKRQVVQQ